MKPEISNTELLEGIKAQFLFRVRPTALPAELRPDWRIPVLVLALSKCGWGGRMSLKKAHVLNWAARDETNREVFLRMMRGERRLDDVVVRFDPSFNRALDFAVGESLVSVERKTTGLVIQLLDSGRSLSGAVAKREDCLVKEKAFFDRVKRIPEHQIQELLDWETSR
jgi:hypothetical protein